jgi:segregation and condensation protein A
MPENTRGMGSEATCAFVAPRIDSAGGREGSGTLTAMSYEVSTSVFEGPFDLLLHLILKQEVDLWEISLSKIVDQYLAELERMESFDLEVTTEFLLIAATLVDLKARRLLPSLEDAELDEELLRFEERDLLLARLLECKTFKDAARAMEALVRRADRSLPRRAGPEEPFASLTPDPLERVAPSRLLAAVMRALAEKPQPTIEVEHIAPIRASVRDAVQTILAALPHHDAVSFRELAATSPNRLETIVRFLAVLELYKQGVVELEQFETFGELQIRRLLEGESALDAASLDEWDDAASDAAQGGGRRAPVPSEQE